MGFKITYLGTLGQNQSWSLLANFVGKLGNSGYVRNIPVEKILQLQRHYIMHESLLTLFPLLQTIPIT